MRIIAIWSLHRVREAHMLRISWPTTVMAITQMKVSSSISSMIASSFPSSASLVVSEALTTFPMFPRALLSTKAALGLVSVKLPWGSSASDCSDCWHVCRASKRLIEILAAPAELATSSRPERVFPGKATAGPALSGSGRAPLDSQSMPAERAEPPVTSPDSVSDTTEADCGSVESRSSGPPRAWMSEKNTDTASSSLPGIRSNCVRVAFMSVTGQPPCPVA
mmetsp:Transcript_12702/g.48698  ORF Transcript_12702/g.48698 Transcript_12702/m.48698 type:complete len:222 (+) Transcript_12702:2354-3019(+)